MWAERIGVGAPLLFLGNMAGRMSALRPLADFVVPHGYQLVLLEHEGVEAVSVLDAAGQVGGILDDLDLDVWLWGYSQGAFVAQELALVRPGRVRGAVLMATLGRQSRFFAAYLEASRDLLCHEVPETVARGFALLATSPPGMLQDDDTEAAAELFAAQRPAGADIARELRSLAASVGYDDRLDALADVSCPCLVVGLGEDVVCSPLLGREVATAIGAPFAEWPGVGHGALGVHPDEAVALVVDFLREQSQRVRA